MSDNDSTYSVGLAFVSGHTDITSVGGLYDLTLGATPINIDITAAISARRQSDRDVLTVGLYYSINSRRNLPPGGGAAPSSGESSGGSAASVSVETKISQIFLIEISHTDGSVINTGRMAISGYEVQKVWTLSNQLSYMIAYESTASDLLLYEIDWAARM